jgi:two-component system chemotaxis sensor kinase CheA
MEGGKTELDRQVLELMKDPITHMVRNAVDHGIETPDVRQKEGKPETGTVLLKAYHGGGQVVIEIKDDGRGLNTEKIKQKILDRELATVEELSTLSPWQILNYIFKPGFSTADVVSHISGRGIGMDVVKTNIEQLGGTIDVRSTFGKGSLFVIKIPLTLTIIPSIIVSVAGHHFAVPQVNVIELVRMGLLSIHSVEHINRVPMLRLREALLPLIYLDELLQLVPQKSQRTMEKNHCIIIIKIGNIHFGMVVDSVFDMQEIVVKPLSAILEVAPYFSGSTILGNGHVIMILDPNTIAANLAESNTLDFSMPFSHTKQDKDSDTVLHITFFSKNDSYAVPLGSVEHIIDLVPQALELRDGIYLCPYQGHAIRVFFPSDDREEINSILAQDSFPLLIFSQLGHTVGFAVHEITNVIEGPVHIDVENRQNGIMGTNFINEQMTSILDPEFFLKTAHPALFTEEDAFF